MTVVNVHTGEVVDPGSDDLTAEQARALTDRIRQTLTVSHDLITAAYKGRAWVALGYETWDGYCQGEFSEARMIRLDREQRREIVAEMRQAGMTNRAIGSAIGISDRQVGTDVEVLRHGGRFTEPAMVTRSDGTPYPTEPRRKDPLPAGTPTPAQKRRPLIDVATDAVFDLTKVTERLERIVADDRFPQNAEQIAAKNRGDLLRAAEALAGVLNRLGT